MQPAQSSFLPPPPEPIALPIEPRPAPRQAPDDRDPERRFFRIAGRWLFWTWRLAHRNGAAFGQAEMIERRANRAEQMDGCLLDLRSYRRMSKDPNFYRASFQFQKTRVDQIQARIKATVDIQIHQATKERWEAWYYHPIDRRVSQPMRNQDRHPITAGSLARCKELVREQFERVVTTWQAYDPAGKLVEAPAPPPAAEAQAS